MPSDPNSGSFSGGQELWLGRLGNLRNVVRQEMVSRQLAAHLPSGGRVLDVGAGQGTQAVRLARLGFEVDAVEPSADMRDSFETAIRDEDAAVRERLWIADGRVGKLAAAARHTAYDVVLCHGVLMYLPASAPVMEELARFVAPGGVLSVLTRNAPAMAWRPALRGDWAGTLAMLDEVESARTSGRDAFYRNEIGVDARADWPEQLQRLAESAGLDSVAWYGVRVACDGAGVDTPAPADAPELAALLDAEERLGATDPYRRLGTLQHVISRRPVAG